MTTKQVNWKTFAGLVEGSLEKAYFVRADLDGAFKEIRSIVNDNLELYVDAQYIQRFRVNIKTVGRIIHIDLKHGLNTLCHWETSCRA